MISISPPFPPLPLAIWTMLLAFHSQPNPTRWECVSRRKWGQSFSFIIADTKFLSELSTGRLYYPYPARENTITIFYALISLLVKLVHGKLHDMDGTWSFWLDQPRAGTFGSDHQSKSFSPPASQSKRGLCLGNTVHTYSPWCWRYQCFLNTG